MQEFDLSSFKRRPKRKDGAGSHSDPATERQINSILNLADRLGMLGTGKLADVVEAQTGRRVPLNQLRKGEAGAVLQALRGGPKWQK